MLLLVGTPEDRFSRVAAHAAAKSINSIFTFVHYIYTLKVK